MPARTFVLTILLGLVVSTLSFQAHTPIKRNRQYAVRKADYLNLLPLKSFGGDAPFLTKSDYHRIAILQDGTFHGSSGEGIYELCLVEDEDLPDVSRFVVNVFGADVISLSQDWSTFEKALLQPAVGFLNSYSGVVAFAEVFSGLKSRLQDRLQGVLDPLSAPKLRGLSRAEKINAATRGSIVLAVARKLESEKDSNLDVIASIELRLQPCDAKIPFSLPWLDSIERRLASLLGFESNSRDLQPYLSNLCVDSRYRGKGLGRALVRCVEDIAVDTWNYSRMYLHVDLDNEPALQLYKSEGYKDVGARWNPFWAGRAADIGYFVKRLSTDKKRAQTE